MVTQRTSNRFGSKIHLELSPHPRTSQQPTLPWLLFSFMTLCTALNLYDSACPQEEIYTLQRAGVMINIYRWPPAPHQEGGHKCNKTQCADPQNARNQICKQTP